jgi:opacity protein-like surface antigen
MSRHPYLQRLQGSAVWHDACLMSLWVAQMWGHRRGNIMRNLKTLVARAVVTSALAALLLPQLSLAQGGPGFLFKSPVVSVGIRTGYAVPSARSDLFDFAREQLTIERSDFNGGFFGFDVGVRLRERLDLVLGVGHARTETASEFRDWVDLDDLPIEQTTTFWTTPVTASLKYYLTDRGRSVGRFAWVPAKISPYVGAGGGMIWYSFLQQGDFVDFETLDIFFDRFLSDGVTGQAHGFAGVELSINPKMFVTAEGRYSWARGVPGRDFIDFDNVDLVGVQFTLGIAARF